MMGNIGKKIMPRKPPSSQVAELVAELVLLALRAAWEYRERRKEAQNGRADGG